MGRRSMWLVIAALGCARGPEPSAPVADAQPPASITAPLPEPVPPPLREVEPTPQIRAAHAAAFAHVLGAGEGAVDPLSVIVAGDAPPWRFVPITPPGALQPFEAALATAGARPVRVAMYGASGTAADTHTAYVRAYLQHRFGDGGPGFVPLGRAKKWSRHAEVTITASGGWTVLHAVRHQDGSTLALGPAGHAFEATRARAWVELSPRRDRAMGVRRIELFALAQPGGGGLRVRIDDGAWTEHATAAETVALLHVPFDVAEGAHRIRVETTGGGPVRLFGVAFERGRGVVVDTLGVDGARARNWQRWDEPVWLASIRARPPALVTVAYGTNEAVDLDRPIAAFAADFGAMLERVRAGAPQAACVVLGPGDFPERTDAGWVPRPRLAEIVAVERELAARHGCGFWDELDFMGGVGSMARWAATRPPLARADHLHFAPPGAALKGHFLVRALVLGHDAAAR